MANPSTLAAQYTPSGATAKHRASSTPAQPPLPTDPRQCRWCRGTRIEVIEGWFYCPRGCFENDNPLSRAVCKECRREFETGLPLMNAVICFECETKEREGIAAGEGTIAEWTATQAVEHESFDRAEAGDQGERMRRRVRQHCWSDLRRVNARRRL